MAHCDSSYLHTRTFVAQNSASHNENLQDLLPPRKRLLLGLKHAAAIPSETPFPPPDSLRIKMHMDAAVPSPVPPHSLRPCSPTQKCFTCGDGDVPLHRVPYLAGSSGYHCSSCVLEMNKKMYCVSCYDVIDEDSPSSRSSDLLTCCRCERLTHFHCALRRWSPSLEGVGLTLCKDCHTRSQGLFTDADRSVQESRGGQRLKEPVFFAGKVKLPLEDKKEVVAARIVAITAKRAALKAKQKAKLLGKAAAHAAVHAKTFLDYMYKLSQKEADDVASDGELKDEEAIAAHRASKSLKTRALSSIVAAEMFSKRDGTMVNHMVTPDYSEDNHTGTSSDSESSKGASPCDDLEVEPGPRVAHKARLAVKRRRSLSLLGLQNSSNTLAAMKRPKIANRKVQKPGFVSKGNLGAIMSQVLANRLSRKAPFLKAKAGGGSHCTNLDVYSESGMKKKVHSSMGAMALENGSFPDDVCLS